ncbi:PGPGW domain-containing protein [Nocardioides mangrovi]|uniref:PGPGW domain-containing protein n=1 Tax=Nocardioides mangrovi TaxID=2874580 RepID=A0ABS7UEM7_9ACTN|nr:PGPGW domain-containing protein [Nocardioides mangrovi]MBZ5739456.1 PGPGW domain-containing protein [Nocardioides mangrovi]
MRFPGGRHAKRIVVETAGWVLVVAGIAALILPGPGLLMVAAGLVILSQEYEWAERRVEPIKRRALQGAADGVATNLRVAMSTLFALALLACGVLWLWGPPVPDWWPGPDSTWLPGGWATGVTQVLSAFIALGLIVWSYRTYRVRGEPRPE